MRLGRADGLRLLHTSRLHGSDSDRLLHVAEKDAQEASSRSGQGWLSVLMSEPPVTRAAGQRPLIAHAFPQMDTNLA